jgi:hypothetical protein
MTNEVWPVWGRKRENAEGNYRDAAVRFGPVQRHSPLNLKLDHRSGSPNPLNLGPDPLERVQMVRFRFRVI